MLRASSHRALRVDLVALNRMVQLSSPVVSFSSHNVQTMFAFETSFWNCFRMLRAGSHRALRVNFVALNRMVLLSSPVVSFSSHNVQTMFAFETSFWNCFRMLRARSGLCLGSGDRLGSGRRSRRNRNAQSRFRNFAAQWL